MKKLNLLKLTLIPSLSVVAFSTIAIASTSCGKSKFEPHMINIHAIEDTKVELISNEGNNPNLSYSPNGKDWDEYIEPIQLSIGSNLYLKGDNSNGFSTSNRAFSHFSFDGKVSISGSIMGLLDNGSASMSEIPNEYCFYGLFRDCSTIISVDKNFLKSAETLKNNCYQYMFYGCTSLENALDLPATTLANSCYGYMFYNCKSLKQAPAELPAAKLANSCYNSMFQNCTALEKAPNLPASTLANSCYNSMFKNCTSLKNAPKLPAPTLADANGCYYSMFYGCKSLENAPDLPATTLANSCYQNMFYGCIALKQAPAELPATKLENSCYNSMFKNCTSLENAPDLPAETLVINCYEHMFYGCSSLSFVKIGYTGDFDQQYFQQWVEGVADSGIFDYKGTSHQTPQDFGFPTEWKLAE